MPDPIRFPAPAARRRASSHLARRTLVGALLLVAFFGGSIALVYWLTDLRPAVVSPPSAPAPEARDAVPEPAPAVASPPAAPPAAVSSRPTQNLIAWPPLPSPAGPATTVASTIEVAFKMDPRLTRGLHMGDRWISPPTYSSSAHPGAEVTIEARARARDSTGRAVKGANPVWTVADPEMVAVAPGERGRVRLTVKRPGRSEVTVTCDGVEKSLVVAAARERGSWRVDIAQR